MTLIIPTQPVPSQTLAVLLAGQPCRLNIYQKTTGLYIDALVNDVLLVGGVLCHNLNRTVRSGYLGFIGDFSFYDTQGTEDPTYASLGSRFLLLYLEAADLAGG